MRTILIIIVQFIYLSLYSQKIEYKSTSEIQDRKHFDIKSTIPYKDGLLSIAVDQVGINSRFDIKLCTITQDLKTEKNLKLNFDTEAWMSILGIFQIDNKPVIFYTLYTSRLRTLHIKAIVLDYETLRVTEVKEIKNFKLEKDDLSLLRGPSSDVEWESTIDIKLSQDKKKYLLIYEPYKVWSPDGVPDNKQIYFAVMDSDAKLLYDKTESYPLTFASVSLKDFCLTSNNKILSLFTLADKPFFRAYRSNYSTYVRSIDIKNGKANDIKFDKELGYVRACKFLPDSTDMSKIEIIGTYSDQWQMEEITGGFHLSYSPVDEKAKTVAKQALPSSIDLKSIYEQYYSEKNHEDRPLYSRLNPIYAGWRENKSIDLVIECQSPYFGKLRLAETGTAVIRYTSCINLNFSNAVMRATVVPKNQVNLNMGGENMIGAFAVPYKDKLLLFYNDLVSNITNKGKVEELTTRSDNYGIAVAEIDAGGNSTTRILTSDFTKKEFAEIIHAKVINKTTILLRVAEHVSRYKKFRISAIYLK